MKKIVISLLVLSFLSTGFAQRVEASEPFLGEIKAFGFDFCPRGWGEAAGQLLPINQNSALFSLYGCRFGGDCRTSFGLPDLRGRSIVGGSYTAGPGLPLVALAEKGGSVSFTLTTNQIPRHSHSVLVKKGRSVTNIANGNFLAEGAMFRGATVNGTALASDTIGLTGGGQAVDKRSPYLGLTYCVALVGLFPPRN